MDPVSLIASIVTIIGAGGTVGRGLRELAQVRHAPRILIQLKEQVSDLHLLIEATSNVAIRHHTVTASPYVLRGLERIQITALALERLIVYDLTTIKNSRGRTEIDKLAWVQLQPRVQDLKAQIQSDMQYFSTSLNLLNVYESSTTFQSEFSRLTAQDPLPLTYPLPFSKCKIREPHSVQPKARDGISKQSKH